MSNYEFQLNGEEFIARAAGTLYWPAARLLAVSDLHLGKSERFARRRGTLLPPYEVRDTLHRLIEEVEATDPEIVICLGDSFDDLKAGETLSETEIPEISRIAAGRKLYWIEGNHDPGPLAIPGSYLAEFSLRGIRFRHIAGPDAKHEISGHYHPKARLVAGGTSPCFCIDENRVVMPAFGTYTGGLHVSDTAIASLFGERAIAVLTGPRALPMPLPGARNAEPA